jgi:hypothetical protein
MPRPNFDTALQYWIELLAGRGLPQNVRWIFHEDFCRIHNGFAFRPRPIAEADRMVRFAFAHTVSIRPIAIVAYAAIGGELITGLQGDVFSAVDDVYVKDWDMYFDTIDVTFAKTMLVHDDETWATLRKAEPKFLSELDYLFSVAALERLYGPIP